MGTVIRPVKGTRDFYPEQMVVRSWLYEQVRAVAERYGYQEYDAPVLETLELYAAKSGEELVKEQSFAFADRGGDMLVLRLAGAAVRCNATCPAITPGWYPY